MFDEIREIKIDFLNKIRGDTRVDANGKILEDLLLVIEKIKIDCLDFTNSLNQISVYKDVDGKVHRTFNHITFSGSYKIKIHRNPLYAEWFASHF